MNEQAIKDILADVVRKVLAEECGGRPGSAGMDAGPIPVEISARHVHLSLQDAIALFGADLHPERPLSQPGQFLSAERVRLIGPKGVMDNVAVLGPTRTASQVEISKTDARALGINPPVRQSGETAQTPGIILASSTGILGLSQGVIVAARHIHMHTSDARRFGLKDKDMVDVRLETERPMILKDVMVRVGDNFALSLHIDADEGNSAGWKPGTEGTIIGRSRGGT
ncbi:MAG: phosphate propanoyltransferase [Desulfovibrio sp.]|jgi:propanediol utilization protein|nr:phosphate propanoyltransferase [Desulfovibrio sp.]